MEVPWESVDLLETHAEISIRDHVAHKRFTLVYRTRSKGSIWLQLTLEPGQRVVRASYRTLAGAPGTIWMEFPLDPGIGRSEVVFETVEQLSPEHGFYRVETFNAFRDLLPLPLARRTVSVRIDSSLGVAGLFSPTHPVRVAYLDAQSATLRMDLRGAATVGRFRFFYALGKAAPPPTGPEAEVLAGSLPPADPERTGFERVFTEPRRFRLRRRASLRRLP